MWAVLGLFAFATMATCFVQCGGNAVDGPSQTIDPGRGGVMAGSKPNGADCTLDAECQSAVCELFADGSRKGRCVATACKECFGLDPSGTSCVPVPDGIGSATCTGGCSSSYSGPSGVRTCCHQLCYCTINDFCGN